MMRCNKTVLAQHAATDSYVSIITAKSTKDGMPPVCAAGGCSACCYEPVYVDRSEIEHALGRVTPQIRKQVKANTQKWLDKVLPSGLLNYKQPNVFDWRALRAPCPFLIPIPAGGEVNGYVHGTCSIYKDRPFACRTHFACKSVAHCFEDALRREQLYILSSSLLESLMDYHNRLASESYCDNLGTILADLLLGKQIPTGAKFDVTKEDIARIRAGLGPPPGLVEELKEHEHQRQAVWGDAPSPWRIGV